MLAANASAPPYLWVYLLVGFPIFFGSLWCGICLLLSVVGGWRRLAAQWPEPAQVMDHGEGTDLGTVMGRVGVVNYNGCLRVRVSSAGLHLAVWKIFPGHQPLFIPWSEIHHATLGRSFFTDIVNFEVGRPTVARLRLPAAALTGRALPAGE